MKIAYLKQLPTKKETGFNNFRICTYLQLMKTIIHYITLQGNLSIKDTVNKGHLSNEDSPQSQPHRAVYKSTSEFGTPLYTGQPAGSQWYPL